MAFFSVVSDEGIEVVDLGLELLFFLEPEEFFGLKKFDPVLKLLNFVLGEWGWS